MEIAGNKLIVDVDTAQVKEAIVKIEHTGKKDTTKLQEDLITTNG